MLLRHYLEQGLSKAAIARLIGVSRRTVYHWIASGQLDRELDELAVRYGPRRPRACKLDGYKALIAERLSAYPRLSATRLFEEVRKAGYVGGYSQIKAYVRSVRPQPAPEPVQRFETPPGLQAQVDFAEFRLPWGVRYALVVVLGYSRLLWFKFYPRQTMAVLMAGLEEAFAAFGGVPQELLFDQLKAVIVDDERMSGGKLLENAQFQRFAAHWRFRIRACRPYRAKTKGKVERPIGYVRQAFFYGREFVSDADLNGQSLEWQAQTANRRLHRTVGESPQARFMRDERAQLQPLAAHSYRPPSAVDTRPGPLPRAARQAAYQPKVEQRPLADYARMTGVPR